MGGGGELPDLERDSMSTDTKRTRRQTYGERWADHFGMCHDGELPYRGCDAVCLEYLTIRPHAGVEVPENRTLDGEDTRKVLATKVDRRGRLVACEFVCRYEGEYAGRSGGEGADGE